MVVGQIDLGRPEGGCLLHNPAQIDVGGADAALRHLPHPQRLVLPIQRKQVDHLVPGPEEVGLQQCVGVFRPAHRLPQVRPALEVARPCRRDQLEQDSGVLPHSGHPAQLLLRGVQHPGQRAEPLHQLVGQPVHIPLGDGVVQQQFQDPVVRPARQSPGGEFIFHPLPVPCMDGSAPLRHPCSLSFSVLFCRAQALAPYSSR